MFFLILLVGILGGVLGGMGMGGGTLLIPALTVFFDVPAKTAAAVNLISFLPMSVVALVFHIKNKLVRFRYVLFIVLPGAVSCVITALLAMSTHDGILKTAFGIFLMVLGVYQLAKMVFKKEKGAKNEKEGRKV